MHASSRHSLRPTLRADTPSHTRQQNAHTLWEQGCGRAVENQGKCLIVQGHFTADYFLISRCHLCTPWLESTVGGLWTTWLNPCFGDALRRVIIF